ncbi:MAG: glycoside hydrolase family 127 protein [Clostridia bacterium]|nr:glycoside hydrolase family 127 protein [Clostridia bacterium]
MHTWNFYTAQEIKPKGWLKRQLEIQAKGLSGNLDKVWKDVKDSAWIGGKAEGWERVPYWLDGFIPLAYLLENDDLISRAKRYVNAIIEHQKPSGWICPCNDDEISAYDTWALQLISKVLVVYYECSSDERVPLVIYKAMKNYYELLLKEKIKLFYWGRYRWFESFIALNFLWERYKEDWIIDLAKILKSQGTDYRQLTELWKRPLNKCTFDTHIVNLVMMLKSEAISCDILNEPYTDMAERLVTILKEYNGTPVGLFTGDECLSGLSPIQGTELCAVVEQMYSYEHLLAYTGDAKWAERLELLAFNALPAAISDDMWTHQYDQMSNQIACQEFPNKPIFGVNGNDAHLFGLEPFFGCCTANFNQAWPKFTLSSFMYCNNTIFSAIPLPSTLKADGIHITLKTQYPFENKLEYSVDAEKDVQLKIRIPSFAKKLRINGKEHVFCQELDFDIPSNKHSNIVIEFEVEPTIFDRPHNLKSVRCGSIVFSLPIKYEKIIHEYEKNGVERKYPYCDYEYIPKSDWNYALSSPLFVLEKRQISDIPFSSQEPPMVVMAEMKKISWGLETGYENVCAKTPESRTALGKAEKIALYPYGCAKLRMTELPLI